MSRRRVYKQETLDTISRFFEALDVIISTKKIRGIQTYCNLYGINKRHLYTQRADLNKGYFEVYWLIPLIRDFGVSSNWLLLGIGNMFK